MLASVSNVWSDAAQSYPRSPSSDPLRQGEQLTPAETTDFFFGVTKLFQSNHRRLRRMVRISEFKRRILIRKIESEYPLSGSRSWVWVLHIVPSETSRIAIHSPRIRRCTW